MKKSNHSAPVDIRRVDFTTPVPKFVKVMIVTPEGYRRLKPTEFPRKTDFYPTKAGEWRLIGDNTGTVSGANALKEPVGDEIVVRKKTRAPVMRFA